MPAPQPTDREQADRLIAAVNDALTPPTAYRDNAPVPTIGSALPVPQPGRPPMSPKAADASVVMLAAGAASIPIGGMTALVIHVLGSVDATTLAVAGAAPAALVLAVATLIRTASRGMQGIHTENHHHYNAPVTQEQHTTSTKTRGLFAKTINKQ